MSFYKQSKLGEKPQFDAVFANRKVINDKYFRIFWRSNGLCAPRIGISVAKKNVKKAVARNKLKRLIKESFRRNYHQLPAIDMIFVLRKEAGVDSSSSFSDELNKKWYQLALDKEKF